MTKFAKVKNAISKSTRFLSSRKYLVALLILLILWFILGCIVKIQKLQSDVEMKPVKIKCHDPNINQPMASQAMSSWKKFFIEFGMCWFSLLSVGIPLTCEFRQINKGTTLGQFCRFSIVWISSLLTGSLFVWLSINLSPFETLAPNFLAACQPHGLDLLCNPDSHLDRDRVVSVTCTTPAQMWIPALSNALPTLAAIQAYLVVITSLNCWCYFSWKGIWGKVSCLVTHAINVALTVGTGCLIIYCNEASSNMDFISNYVISFSIAIVWILVGFYWCGGGVEEPELPRYWNDVLGKEIIPGTGQLPTNPIPSRYYGLPATTGPIAGDDDINANNPPPYSKLKPGNEDPPPDYATSVSLIRY